MLTLTEQEVLVKIQNLTPFEAKLSDGSLTIRVAEYQPYVATAIHQGHRLRDDLEALCLLNEDERYFEEDPNTGEFIASLPIVLQAEDSRYEYDLNRSPDECVYEEAWGKQVWASPLPAQERIYSQRKHAQYYRIFKCLLETLEYKFGFCLVYDLHSYNYQRIARQTPTFNLGTKQVDTGRWRNEINDLVVRLGKIELPNLDVVSRENDVFYGMGYQATFVRDHFKQTLILPVEIKKVYMDERRGESYPLVIDKLKEELKTVLSEHAAFTLQKMLGGKRKVQGHILSSNLHSDVRKVDHQLYNLAKNLETLLYINPNNLRQEKRRFLNKPHSYQPQFTYRQLDIDPYLFREQLYRLPVDSIRDADVQKLYRKVIDQLAIRIDLLTSIGQEEFLYNSLRYYGQPDEQDINNAHFIMHAASYEEAERHDISPEQAIAEFRAAADEYGIDCRIVGTNKLVARAMVSGKTLKVNTVVQFGRKDLDALIHHELGVHIVTSVNAEKQPLKILKLGLPGNTHTQEGLAILCEHLSGSFSLSRLKTLALRVIAVNMMVKGETFNHTFQTLKQDYKLSDDSAFTTTARVFRGGGFTKDYLYLRGVRDALQCYQNEDLTALFTGKTSFEFKPLLEELIARGILRQPSFIPKALTMKKTDDPILNYMMQSIK